MILSGCCSHVVLGTPRSVCPVLAGFGSFGLLHLKGGLSSACARFFAHLNTINIHTKISQRPYNKSWQRAERRHRNIKPSPGSAHRRRKEMPFCAQQSPKSPKVTTLACLGGQAGSRSGGGFQHFRGSRILKESVQRPSFVLFGLPSVRWRRQGGLGHKLSAWKGRILVCLFPHPISGLRSAWRPHLFFQGAPDEKHTSKTHIQK